MSHDTLSLIPFQRHPVIFVHESTQACVTLELHHLVKRRVCSPTDTANREQHGIILAEQRALHDLALSAAIVLSHWHCVCEFDPPVNFRYDRWRFACQSVRQASLDGPTSTHVDIDLTGNRLNSWTPATAEDVHTPKGFKP